MATLNRYASDLLSAAVLSACLFTLFVVLQ